MLLSNSKFRRLLKNSELPKEQYIRTEDGRYRFESSFPIEIDVVQFEHLLEQADKAGACEQRLELLNSSLEKRRLKASQLGL